jgi:hypothetical protein
MKLYSLIFALAVLASCKGSKPERHYLTITKYQRVGEGYSYSNDLMRYNGGMYRPMISAVYSRDSLIAAALYKPEGKIDYNKKQLDEDAEFKRLLGVPEIRRITVMQNEVMDNKRRYVIQERKNDSIFCMQSDTLFLFKVH